jgi:hypothetical protein
MPALHTRERFFEELSFSLQSKEGASIVNEAGKSSAVPRAFRAGENGRGAEDPGSPDPAGNWFLSTPFQPAQVLPSRVYVSRELGAAPGALECFLLTKLRYCFIINFTFEIALLGELIL